MGRNTRWTTNGADASDELLDDQEEAIKHPNQKAQDAIESNGQDQPSKPGPGRKPDPANTRVEIELTEIERHEGIPPIIITGTGRRHDVKPVTLPIPNEIFKRVKSETSNASASLIALMKYGLEKLDEENKSLHVKHIKTTE